MDFNLPRYTEYFDGTCTLESLIDVSANEACQVKNGKKIYDEKYNVLRTKWLKKWDDVFWDDPPNAECKDALIEKLITELTTTDIIIGTMKDDTDSNKTSITNRHTNLNNINDSMDDIESNFLLGEQRLLETNGLNYINNAKFYIFIALIIILLLIQLMLILL